MKKLILLLTAAMFVGNVFSQAVDMNDLQKKIAVVQTAATDTTNNQLKGKWTKKGMIGVNLSQASFKNWAGGGENSFALNATFNGGAYYRKNRSAWDNELSLGYGALYTKANDWRKTSDNIDLSSKYGYAASKYWFYSALVGFSTQFAKGYNYPDESVYLSKFMAPAYLVVSLGMDYKPNNNFSAFLSPLTGKFTFVLDDSLSHVGAFGVDIDKKMQFQLGAYTRFSYNADIMTNVNLMTKLELFTAYDKNFGNIDVNWEVAIGMKINKYLSATLNTTLKYDNDIEYIDTHGVARGPRIQFKEILGVGFAYKF